MHLVGYLPSCFQDPTIGMIDGYLFSSFQVGYATGSSQEHLPSSIMSELDDLLVPIIHNAGSHHRRRSLNVELLFKVLRLL